jgi:hypothetical protein
LIELLCHLAELALPLRAEASLQRFRAHLTLFGPSQPSAATADPIVAESLAEVAETAPAPSADQPPPDVLTVRITAAAFGPHDARVSRSAIVRIGAVLPLGCRDRFHIGMPAAASAPKPRQP